MATVEAFTVSMRLAWWLRWYLKAVFIAFYLTGCVPNEKRLTWWIKRGTKVVCNAN